jgi:hypothetical protein
VLITNASGCLPAEMVTTGGTNAAQADGGDIRFSTDAAGTSQIACEITAWTQDATAANAIAEIWVPVSVSASVDTTIYVWYSAGGGQTQPSASSTFGSQKVWDSNYISVYHMQTIGARPAGSSPDSTASAYDVFNNGSSNVTTTAGPFASGGNGGSFAGDVYFLAVPSGGHGSTPTNVPTGNTAWTLEGWFKKTSATSAMEFFGWGSNNANTNRRAVYWQNDGKIFSEGRACNATFPWTADTSWHQVVHTYPGSATSNSIVGYLDGVSQTMTGDGNTPNIQNNTIVISGIAGAPGNNGFFGTLDEVRISKIQRSSTWVSTQYNNMHAPGSFIVAGTPTTPGGSTPLSNPFYGVNPIQGYLS